MALAQCPSCDKKISSQVTLCPHCGFQRGEVDEEALKEFRRREIRDNIYHLNMGSYAALTLLVAAFAWYWVETEGFLYRSPNGPYVLFSVGAITYLVIRAFMFKRKADLKKLRQ
jgi:hypothetical protein